MNIAPIYLDYNATTPLDPAVIEAMQPFLRSEFGNPSSAHEYGRRADDAVEHARTDVANLLGAHPDEIVFTGGGTEASNHALKGAVFARLQGVFGRLFGAWSTPHIVTCAIEHPATLQPCEFLRRLGCAVAILPVDRHGLVDPDAVRKALTRRTVIVSIMHANNEVGTLQPIREIAQIVKRHGALMHTDAAQSLGKIAVDVNELGVDLLTIAGHKLYAPKASAPCSCGAACGWSRSCTARAMSRDGERARKTCRISWRSARRVGLRVTACPRQPNGCGSSVIGSGSACRPRSARRSCSTAIPSAGCRPRST